jgi:hypothetical protein
MSLVKMAMIKSHCPRVINSVVLVYFAKISVICVSCTYPKTAALLPLAMEI